LRPQLDFAEDTLGRKKIFQSTPSPEIGLAGDPQHIRALRRQPLKSDKVYFSHQSDVRSQKVSFLSALILVFDGRVQIV
jgi:hypothetical protein